MSDDRAAESLLRAERDRLSLLLDVTNLLVSHPDLSELFQALSEALSRVIPHEYATVSLYQTRGQIGRALMHLVVLDGRRRPELEQREFVVRHAAETFARGEGLTFDIDTLGVHNPTLYGMFEPLGLRSFSSVPLVTARGQLGVLTVASRRRDAFEPSDAAMLREVSGQIAVAIENSLAFEEIRRLRDQLLSEKRYLETELREQHDFRNIVGQSETLRRVLQQVDTVAPTDSTVLLIGETGTGKELVARAIHERSPRRAQSFVRVNCAAIPLSLVESEMFGHERGAFTGAIAARPGRFEVANRGTLFLDEVGDLPPEVQPKLLRAIQEREIERLGSTSPVRIDVRLIAATNRDLAAMVSDGDFRGDLYYRLTVFPIRLPPLRERRDDIPALVRHFVAKHASRLKRSITGIPAETMEALCAWNWPGNIRELENVIERATILATDGVLRVPAGLAPVAGAAVPAATPIGDSGPRDRLEEIERNAILDALRAADGVVGGPTGAAARLGLQRTTLQSRMKRLGIRRAGY